jgi:hypothetical protein
MKLPLPYEAIRVRMIIQVHVFGFVESRFHRVIARRLIGGIPVRHRRTGRDVQDASFLGELGIIQRLSLGFFTGVYFSCPAWGGDATSFNRAGCFCGSLGMDRRGNECDNSSRKGEIMEETHSVAFHDRLYMGYSLLNGVAGD